MARLPAVAVFMSADATLAAPLFLEAPAALGTLVAAGSDDHWVDASVAAELLAAGLMRVAEAWRGVGTAVLPVAGRLRCWRSSRVLPTGKSFSSSSEEDKTMGWATVLALGTYLEATLPA